MSFTELNVQSFRMINDLGKQFEGVNPLMALIAENMIYVLAAAVIFFLFSGKGVNRLMIVTGFVALIFAEITGKIAGSLHSNNQPFAELSEVNKLIDMGVNNSFPSDHTIIFFTMTVSFWLFKRKQHSLWVVLACIVGLSRIWVGVHYPADVAAGAIIGATMAYIGYRILPNVSFMKKLVKSDEYKAIPGNEMKNL
ncbi:undecaprenyl-diphosphatase [Bacillus sp. JJ1609]|uniref:undecaprenyl-diphosphatase n=1 Tax=Bacillus sp. JJ1609 TaxID=3122977 RepID=UPI003000E323